MKSDSPKCDLKIIKTEAEDTKTPKKYLPLASTDAVFSNRMKRKTFHTLQ